MAGANGGRLPESLPDGGKLLSKRFRKAKPAAFRRLFPADLPEPGAEHPALMRGPGAETHEELMKLLERI